MPMEILGNIALSAGASQTHAMGWSNGWHSTEAMPGDFMNDPVLTDAP